MLDYRGLWLFLLVVLIGGKAAHAQDRPVRSQAAAGIRMDSLERVALTTPDLGHRLSAILGIQRLGEVWVEIASGRGGPEKPEVYYPGVVSRLVRIYQQHQDYGTRDFILRGMSNQAERSEAIDFLQRIAQETEPHLSDLGEGLTRPAFALSILSHMGPEGRAGLERLHLAGAVKEPMARHVVDSPRKTRVSAPEELSPAAPRAVSRRQSRRPTSRRCG